MRQLARLSNWRVVADLPSPVFHSHARNVVDRVGELANRPGTCIDPQRIGTVAPAAVAGDLDAVAVASRAPFNVQPASCCDGLEFLEDS